MKILVAGDWYSDVHEDGVYHAYKEIGHEVFKFKWHQYFQFEEKTSSFISIIKSFYYKFQNKFIIGPIVTKINFDFIKVVEKYQPDIISFYRATHITPTTLRKIKNQYPSTFLISHNEDNPFTKGHPYWLWRNFLSAISEYDLVLAHRLSNVEQYKNAGAKNVRFLRSWFDPKRTHAVKLSKNDKLKFECDVVFAGHFEDDGRIKYLEEIVKNGFKLKLFGPGKYWDPVLRKSKLLAHLAPLEQVWGDDYNKALCGAKVALCFMSKLNEDNYTRRCFEIPATNTVLVSEYSDELSSLYNAEVEADFFKSKQQLIQILQRYVDDEVYRKTVAKAGHKRVVVDGHDVVSRMKRVLEWFNEIKKKDLKENNKTMFIEKIKTQSLKMKFFRAIGLESIAWSLRRLHCPVSKNDLVLEVGSGGNPYPRANVLLDAYEETSERYWAPLIADRPIVLGFGEKLPFKDKSFDFVIASHVLEHSSQPEKFLAELQRVAKAGYIEVPDAFMERINPYTDHRLEITCREKKLIIKKKPRYVVEHDIVELYENRVKPFLTQELIPKRPFAFHVRYYWKDKIDFTVMNADVDASWTATEFCSKSEVPVMSIKSRLKDVTLNAVRLALSQNIRNKKIDLFNLLLCPSCSSTLLSKTPDRIKCNDCNATYQLQQNIPTMFPQV